MRNAKENWSRVPENPRATAIRHEIAELMQSIERLFIPARLAVAEGPPWENARILSRAEGYSEIAALKARESRAIAAILSRPPAAFKLIRTPVWPGSGNLPGVYQVTPVKP
jgi:hypothetical protein